MISLCLVCTIDFFSRLLDSWKSIPVARPVSKVGRAQVLSNCSNSSTICLQRRRWCEIANNYRTHINCTLSTVAERDLVVSSRDTLPILSTWESKAASNILRYGFFGVRTDLDCMEQSFNEARKLSLFPTCVAAYMQTALILLVWGSLR